MRIEFILFLYLFPVPIAAARSATFSILYIPQPVIWEFLLHYYIPDSPSTTFLFVFSPHDGWPAGKTEKRREAVRWFTEGDGSEQQWAAHRWGKIHWLSADLCPTVKIPAHTHTHTQKTRMKTLRQYDTVIHEMAPLVCNTHDPIGCSRLASVGFRTFLDSDMF